MNPIDFKFNDNTYTPERPCWWGDERDQCQSGDLDNWVSRAHQFLIVLEERADRMPERVAVVSAMRGRIAVIAQRGCAFIAVSDQQQAACRSAVQALISTIQLTMAYAEDWGERITDADLAFDWGTTPPKLPTLLPGGQKLPDLSLPGDVTHPGGGMFPGLDFSNMFGGALKILPLIAALLVLNNVRGLFGNRGCRR